MSTCSIDLNKFKNLTDGSEEQLFWEDFVLKFRDSSVFDYAAHNAHISKDDHDYKPNFMTPFEFVTVSPIDISKLITNYQSDVEMSME